MAKKHTIPVHLEREDRLIYGLTTRQVLTLALGLTFSYSFGSQVWEAGLALSLLCAAIPAILSSLVAFLKVGGMSLDQWLLIWLLYMTAPHTYVWEPFKTATTSPSFDEVFLTSQEEVEEEEE